MIAQRSSMKTNAGSTATKKEKAMDLKIDDGRKMNTIRQTAERENLNEYRIDTPSGQVQTKIALQRRIFTAKQAPLTPSLEALGISDTPTVTVQGKDYRFFKSLRNDKVFANHFDLGLQALDAKQSSPAITARYGGKGWTTMIRFEGAEYSLKPTSWFGFGFELRSASKVEARFKDVSPFLTFSSRRRYLIESSDGALPPLLMAFAFLLALSSTYRLGL